MPWILFWPLLLVLALWYLGVLGPDHTMPLRGGSLVPMMLQPQPQVPPALAAGPSDLETFVAALERQPDQALLVIERESYAVVYSDGLLERELGGVEVLGLAWRDLVDMDVLPDLAALFEGEATSVHVPMRDAAGEQWVPTRWSVGPPGPLFIVLVDDLTLEEAQQRLAETRRTIEGWSRPPEES